MKNKLKHVFFFAICGLVGYCSAMILGKFIILLSQKNIINSDNVISHIIVSSIAYFSFVQRDKLVKFLHGKMFHVKQIRQK